MLHDEMKAESSIEDILLLLSNAQEYHELPVRHNEDAVNWLMLICFFYIMCVWAYCLLPQTKNGQLCCFVRDDRVAKSLFRDYELQETFRFSQI